MKRSIALFLILAFVLSSVPAFADWGDWGSYNPGNAGAYTVTGSTNLYSASSAQLTNINLAVGKLSSFDVGYGETFSFNAKVGPRSDTYGYKAAVNGRGAVARGGGVGQVATTLFLALKQIDGINFTVLETWGDEFKLSYTPNGDDAVLTDYNNGRDFAFINNAGYLHVEMWASRSYLYCTISVTPYSYGVQTGSRVGYASIVLSGTNTLKNNVRLAANSVNDTWLYYYNEFSFNQIVGPRTAQYGYGDAKNGRGVVVKGGGVAQVASVIYLAIKDLSNVKITEKRTYDERYNQNYVSSADDAIVTDYSAKQDFRFRYMGYGTLVINTYISNDGTRLVCEVYERY